MPNYDNDNITQKNGNYYYICKRHIYEMSQKNLDKTLKISKINNHIQWSFEKIKNNIL